MEEWIALRGLLFVLTVAGIMLWPTLALADVVHFSGSTSGEMTGTGESENWWTYEQNSFFDVFTNAGGNVNLDDLGRIMVIVDSDTVDNDVFRLTISFAIPLGVNGNPLTLDADIEGKYTGSVFKKAKLQFPDGAFYTYSNSAGSGSFELEVNETGEFGNGQWANISGQIKHATFTATAIPAESASESVPEPASIVLLGTLLSGIGLLARRKLAR